jgi:hypothetical protein
VRREHAPGLGRLLLARPRAQSGRAHAREPLGILHPLELLLRHGDALLRRAVQPARRFTGIALRALAAQVEGARLYCASAWP